MKNFSHKLLRAFAIGGIVAIAATNPFFGIKAIGALQKELKKKKWKEMQNGLYGLKRRGFIEVEQNADGVYIVKTTKAGRIQAQKYNLEEICIEIPKKWDKHWRLVIFDIPVYKQKARLAFLQKLRELGFILLQRSIWAHPFESRNEIAVLARAFEIDGCWHYLVCSDISAGDYLRVEFEKRNSIIKLST